MSTRRPDPEAFAREVAERTRQGLQDLRDENERLHRLIASMRGGEAPAPDPKDPEGLRALLAEARRENAQQKELLLRLLEEQQRHRQQEERLAEQLVRAEQESRQFSQRSLELEQQTMTLSSLFVACHRLHESLDRREVLTSLREIVINMIGSEELAILVVDASGERLRLEESEGIDPDRLREVPLGHGVIGATALGAEPFLAGAGGPAELLPHERGLTACVPLRLEDRPVGAIAIFGMLPQKRSLEPVDHQLFALLTTHGGIALASSRPRLREVLS